MNQLDRLRGYRKCVLEFFQQDVTAFLMKRDWQFFSSMLYPLYESAVRIDQRLLEDPHDNELCDLGIVLIDTIIEMSIARKKEIQT